MGRRICSRILPTRWQLTRCGQRVFAPIARLAARRRHCSSLRRRRQPSVARVTGGQGLTYGSLARKSMACHVDFLDAWKEGHGRSGLDSKICPLHRYPHRIHVESKLQSPVYTLVGSPESPRQEARSFLTTDPALVVIYKQLRDKTLQTLKGASKISPRAEWQFVLQTARLYDRMGCDLLALDLGMSIDLSRCKGHY